MNVTKECKLRALKIEEYKGPEEYLDMIYKYYVLKEHCKNEVHKPKKAKKLIIKSGPPVDKTTIKYKLLLEYVNNILKNMGKEAIDDLTEFKEIDRLDIIKEKNKEMLDEMAPTLFKHFRKQNYYRKTKSIVLNCMRGMCKEVGVQLINRKQNIVRNTILKTHFFYTIYN